MRLDELQKKAKEKTKEVAAEDHVSDVVDDDVPFNAVFEKAQMTNTKAGSAEDDVSDEQYGLPLHMVCTKRKKAVISSDEAESEVSEAASVGSLNDDHKSVLLTVFQEEISKGKLLTMPEVRTKMSGDLYLRPMLVNRNMVKKISDFVRHKTNHTRHMQLAQLSDLGDTGFVATSSIESGLRKSWNAHDSAVIESKFGSLTNVKGKKEILKILSSDPVLAHILEREGTGRCNEKVKNFLRGKKE